MEGERNSNATRNRYRAAIRAFSAWLSRANRIAADPLRAVEIAQEEATGRRERRFLGAGEFAGLVAATASGEPWRGIAGPDRALIYLLAASTGQRHEEIQSLRVRDFELAAAPPAVRLHGSAAKNGKRAKIPLRRSLADDLAAHFAGRKPGDPAFPMPGSSGAAMLRFDLARCEPPIPYRDEQGRYFDFHSLRHQFATMLDEMGVRQRLMRHSTPVLTSRYTRHVDEALVRAVESLPLPGRDGAVPGAAPPIASLKQEPGLRDVVAAWPTLPTSVREAILAMVAAGKQLQPASNSTTASPVGSPPVLYLPS